MQCLRQGARRTADRRWGQAGSTCAGTWNRSEQKNGAEWSKERQQHQAFFTIVIHAGRVTIGLETVNRQPSNHPSQDFVDCFGLAHPRLEKAFGQMFGVLINQRA